MDTAPSTSRRGTAASTSTSWWCEGGGGGGGGGGWWLLYRLSAGGVALLMVMELESWRRSSDAAASVAVSATVRSAGRVDRDTASARASPAVGRVRR